VKYTIILAFTYSPAWLQKTRAQREAFNAEHLRPIFAKYAASVSVRFFDAEAFVARFSDFAIFETEDLRQYYYLIEELRDSPLFAGEIARIADVFMGIEDGHQQFEADAKAAAR